MPDLPEDTGGAATCTAVSTKRQRRPSVRLCELGGGNLLSTFYYDHLLPRQHRRQNSVKRSKVSDDVKKVDNDNDESKSRKDLKKRICSGNGEESEGDLDRGRMGSWKGSDDGKNVDNDDDDDSNGGLISKSRKDLKKIIGSDNEGVFGSWTARVSMSKGNDGSKNVNNDDDDGNGGGLISKSRKDLKKRTCSGNGEESGRIGSWQARENDDDSGNGGGLISKSRKNLKKNEGDIGSWKGRGSVSTGGEGGGFKARGSGLKGGKIGTRVETMRGKNLNDEENEDGVEIGSLKARVLASRGGRKGSNVDENLNESGNDDENEGGLDGVAISRGGRKGSNLRRGHVGDNQDDEDVLEDEGDLDGVAIGSWKGRVSGVRGRGGLNNLGSKLVGESRNENGDNEVDRNFEPIGSEEEEEYREENHDDSDSSEDDGNGNLTGGRGDDNGVGKGNDLRFQVSDEMEDPSDLSERNGVKGWLKKLGLQRYALNFEIHEVDDEVLPLLTLEDLKDMGITAVGSRRKLFCSIQNLNN